MNTPRVLFFTKASPGLVLRYGPSGKRRWMQAEEWGGLVDRAVQNGSSRTSRNAEWGDFSPVEGRERLDIENAIKIHLGVDVSLDGYVHHASEDVVRKVIADHGDLKSETDRGQVPVTIDDIKGLPSWINKGVVVAVGRTMDGLISLTRAHTDGNVITYVQEIRTGRKKLAIKTMWKRPGRIAPAKTASTQLSTTTLPGPLKKSISHPDLKSNRRILFLIRKPR